MGVDLADVDLERGTLAVLRKGGVRDFLVELPGETAAALAEWIVRRGSRPREALSSSQGEIRPLVAGSLGVAGSREEQGGG